MSDDYDSQDFESGISSDSEDVEGSNKKPAFERFISEIEGQNPKFNCGLIFSSKAILKDAVREHKVKYDKVIMVERSDRTRFVGEGHRKKCKWGFYAKRIYKSNDWQIITINDKHSCNRSFNPRLVSPKYPAKRYLDDFEVKKMS